MKFHCEQVYFLKKLEVVLLKSDLVALCMSNFYLRLSSSELLELYIDLYIFNIRVSKHLQPLSLKMAELFAVIAPQIRISRNLHFQVEI